MNHLWFGMSLKDAVQAPRVHSQLIPDKVFVETRFSNDTASILEMYGHKVCYKSSLIFHQHLVPPRIFQEIDEK